MLRNTHAHAKNVNGLINLGAYDRFARLLLAAALLSPAFVDVTGGPLGWMTLALLAAVYPAMTAITGWDPVYQGLGIDTAKGQSAALSPRATVGAGIGRPHQTGAGVAANDPPDTRKAA